MKIKIYMDSYDNKISLKMVVLIRSTQFIFIIIICILFTNVQGVNNKLYETVNKLCNREAMIMAVEKHLERIPEVSPLHIIIDLKVDAFTLNTMLMKYITTRSIYLRDNDKLSHTPIVSMVKLNRRVGIYSDITEVKAREKRRLFGKAWEPRAKILLWIVGSVFPEIVETVLEQFWSLGCLNVAVVIQNPRCGINRYTYNPFMLNSHSTRGKLIKLDLNATFFPNKQSNLYGFKIPISLYHAQPSASLVDHTTLEGASGSSVEGLRYLSQALNFTIALKSSKRSISSYTQRIRNKKYNYTQIGVAGDLIKGRSIILGNPQTLDYATEFDLDFIYPLENLELLMVVPKDKELSSMKKLFRYVNLTTELIFVICITLFSIYIAIIHKRSALITYFRLMFQVNVEAVGNRLSERIFFFAILILVFFINCVHESHIIESLTDHTIPQRIKTYKDIIDSDLKIVVTDMNHLIYNIVDTDEDDGLAHRAEVNLNFDLCLRRLISGERVACIGTSLIVNTALHVLGIELISDKQNITVQPHVIHSGFFYSSTWIVKNGFPFLKGFNTANFAMNRFGMNAKWRKEQNSVKFKESEYQGALNFSHLQGLFYIYTIAIIVAIIVFICEIILHQMNIKLSK